MAPPDLTLFKSRPEGRAGLYWDAEVGKQYKAISGNPAFLHLLTYLYNERERLVSGLVKGDEDADQYRLSIQVLERALLIPDLMIKSGRESESDLRIIEG